jgi:hypothetical protein
MGIPKPWTQSIIVPIFKREGKNNPSNYRNIIIIPLLARFYGIILEKRLAYG